MRVLNIILEPRLGGPQLRIADIGRVLQENHGVESLVMFPVKNSEKYRQYLDKQGLKWKALKLHKLSRDVFLLLKWFLFMVPETLRLKRAIRELDPAIVDCNGSWQFKGIIAAKMAGKKVVCHLNDTKMPAVIRLFFGFLSKRIDGYIYVAPRVRDYYIKQTHAKNNEAYSLIHSGVDTGLFDPANVEPDRRLAANGKLKVITIANVNPVKGLEYFIRVAHLVNQNADVPDAGIEFIIVGDKLKSKGKYVEKLERMIDDYKLDNLRFHGFSDSVPAILKAADIYVCSSASEASPKAVWEALAMETPVVSTDVGSVSDFVKNNETGFVVPVGDSEAIADKVLYLAAHKELREEFGVRGRAVAVDQLDIDLMARRHVEFYQRVLGNENVNGGNN
ncbi:MAG: glycosyltransferase [bacterium]|nr:glycosyltransferase [bacterium]